MISDSGIMKPRRSKPWEDDYRIPNDTYANHYDLYLHPDLEAGTFSGKVTVHITATNPVKRYLEENFNFKTFNYKTNNFFCF